jgi:hypothetical protein
MSENTTEEKKFITLDDLNYFWMPNGAPCFIANNYDVVDDYCDVVESFGFQIYYIITDKETSKTIQVKNDKNVMVPTEVFEYAPAIFKVVNNFTGRAVMESKEAFGNDFCPVKEVAEYTMPSIPRTIIDKLDEFFRLVHAQHGSESIVILTYDTEKTGSEGWGVLVPEQENNSVHCKYDNDSIAALKPDHVMIVGSVHSHPEMSAYASGTDHADQADFDGVHITYGWQKTVNNGATQYHIELQIGGNNYILKPEDVFEYNPPPTKDPDPEVLEWSSKVKKALPLNMGGSVSQVATTPSQSYQTAWAKQTTSYQPIQNGTVTDTVTTTRSFPQDRNKFLADLGSVEADAIVAIEIDESTNPDLNCLICNFALQDLDVNSGFCMTCDTPLISTNMGHFDILEYMAFYCQERKLDQTVPFYVYCIDENNTSSNFLINIKPAGMMPGDIASPDKDDEVPYDPTILQEYTVCCNLPLEMVDSCCCPVLVLEEDIADFDKAHARIDIYDSTSDCLQCDNYYQVTCPAFRQSLVDFKTYNKLVDGLITKCENYVYYKNLNTYDNFERTGYYD